MLTPYQSVQLLQTQYDGNGSFDLQARIGEVSVAIKQYSSGTNICFEGSHNIPDWFSNFRAFMIEVDDVKIEYGFWENIEDTYKQIFPLIQKGKPVEIKGHSRGAGHTDTFAYQMIRNGFDPKMIFRTKFGCPRSGNQAYVNKFIGSPALSYQNAGHGFLDCDLVCHVPVHFTLEPYLDTDPWLYVNEEPASNDNWLLLKWHHLFLYETGVKDAPGFVTAWA